MSKCDTCKREMQTADGCVLAPVELKNGKTMDPIRFGDEIRYPGWVIEAHERCHDCNCKKGEYHHPGCDWEECPNCRTQMLMCSGECGGTVN